MKRSKRLLAASMVCGAAAMFAAAAPIATATVPMAGEGPSGKALVVIGDSYSANGDIVTALKGGAETGCHHKPTSWPTQLSQRMGLVATHDVEDTSCMGGSLDAQGGWTLAHQARLAAADGAFGPRTKTVAIQLGLNDFWGTTAVNYFHAATQCAPDFLHGCGPEAAAEGRSPDYRAVTGPAYASRAQAVVDYIRYYAPNAHLVFVGYPELHTPGQQAECVGVIGIPAAQPQAGAISDYQDRIDAAQRDAAAILHIDFFDTRAVTAGHGPCTADPWVDGVLDPHGDPLGIPQHPTAHGDAMVAAAFQQWITQH